MKKTILTLFMGILFTSVFAQKIIESPEYGLCTISGSITKIELLDTGTALHFHIKTYPNGNILVSKKNYIEAVGSDKKLFVTKADGIEIGKESKASASGEIFYTLYFPKLNDNVKTIDFGDTTNEENGSIYDIVVDDKKASTPPKALRGNWMLTDGSNLWEYGFYYNNAIIDRAVWNYKSIDVKGKKYTITLEREGKLKTVYAKLNKNEQVDFGASLKTLKTYSLEKTHNPNYKLKNDIPYSSDSLLKIDSTTFSGVIKGYTNRVKEKAFVTIYIQDCFTLKVDPHKVKIRNDGSFSVKFPANTPQIILLMSPYGFQQKVFVEPGKETFHYINDRAPLFMGDCAQLNSSLKEMESIDSFNNGAIMKKIGERTVTVSPEDHKKACLELRDKELNTLIELNEKQFLSKKALQIKKINIEFQAMDAIISYERFRKYTIKNMASKTDGKDEIAIKDFKMGPSFYDFISKDIANDRLGILASPRYGFFTKQLTSASIFKNNSDSDIEKNIEEQLGLSKSFMLDYIRFQRVYKKFIDKYETYSDSEIKVIKQEINDSFLSDYIVTANERAKRYIEENNKKTGYNINTVEKAEGEELFETIIKKFKGKVIYIDFWATWCGPCLPMIKDVVPLKKEMKNENVVFLYITTESSPEGQWKDAIANIEGEHYRVSKDEWKYLLTKFNFSGIPHYILVNKKGEVVNPNIGQPSNKKLKAILKEEIAK